MLMLKAYYVLALWREIFLEMHCLDVGINSSLSFFICIELSKKFMQLCLFIWPQGQNRRKWNETNILICEKRGFQFHFIVKVMVQIPKITIITYNMYKHKYNQGWPCHGQDNTLGDARSMHQPKLSRGMVSNVESCFFLEVSIDSVCKNAC